MPQRRHNTYPVGSVHGSAVWTVEISSGRLAHRSGTKEPLWAQPAFDDASWETVDLTPKDAVNPFQGLSGYVPGWGERGHPGYSGYAWYRIRVKVQAQPGEKLALAGPANFDDAYQLFLNGTLLGAFGRFREKRPTYYYSAAHGFSPARECQRHRRAGDCLSLLDVAAIPAGPNGRGRISPRSPGRGRGRGRRRVSASLAGPGAPKRYLGADGVGCICCWVSSPSPCS